MKNMKISSKLMVGFLIVTILAAIVGVVGILGLTTMDNAANAMYSQKAKPLGDLATAMEYFQRLRVGVRNAIIYTGNADQLKTVESDMNNRITQFETAMANYEPTIVTENGKNLFAEIMDKYSSTFKPGILNVLDNAKKGASVDELLNQMAVTTDAANVIADDLSNLTQARMDVMSDASAANTNLGNTLLIVIIAVIVVAVAASIVLAVYISGLISKPVIFMKSALWRIGAKGELVFADAEYKLAERYASAKDEVGQSVDMLLATVRRLVTVGKELETVANGDLTVQVNLLSENDTMGLSLQKMVENLNNMFTDINNASVQVTSGSRQIADGSQLLAQGSMEQSASVEQLSASIADVAGKTAANAEMARQAADLSSVIKGNAEKGSSQMEQMLQAVKDINEASSSIGKVIKVIDDIAFQTNILALNAAVEAARAGQHGKGFAVVADEVRNLAAKSAVAAKDTSGLIENSIEKANLGSQIATETSASLLEIVEGIKKNAEIIMQIAQSSDEQSAAIAQINSGIDQVAQVVQQNSATAEESAAASEEMSGQSDVLKELVSQFKLKGSAGYPSVSPNPIVGSRSGSSQKPAAADGNTAFAFSGSKY